MADKVSVPKNPDRRSRISRRNNCDTSKSASKKSSTDNNIKTKPPSTEDSVCNLPSSERTVIGREVSPSRNVPSDKPSSKNIIQKIRQKIRTNPSDGDKEFDNNIRPEADGSEDLDPEIEELSKLRCTSVSTEIIAEKELRRKKRQRRCADYPGLAFGSSLFSSDTMMRFSIIYNELHNTLISQLKRVSNYVPKPGTLLSLSAHPQIERSELCG